VIGCLNQVGRYFSSKSLEATLSWMLLEFGANPISDSFRPCNEQPMWTEEMCRVDATTALINYGLDLNRRRNNPPTGGTILHHWASYCPYDLTEEDSLDIVQLLAEKGADLMVRDDEGFNPLLTAANLSHTKMLDYLLDQDEEGIQRIIESRRSLLNCGFIRRYWRWSSKLIKLVHGPCI